jgi:hypothetical protein
MLARTTVNQIWHGNLKLAAIFVGLQLPVAAGIASNLKHTGDVPMHVANTIGQTLLGMLDACLLGQMVHAVSVLFASDMVCNPAQAIAGIVSREVVAHLVSLAFQILS